MDWTALNGGKPVGKSLKELAIGLFAGTVVLVLACGVSYLMWNRGAFQDDYKGTATAILQEDGVSPADQAKMEPGLTDSIGRCCAKYRCKPADVHAAARQLRDEMRKTMPGTTLTLAANTIYEENSTSLQNAVAEKIKAFSK